MFAFGEGGSNLTRRPLRRFWTHCYGSERPGSSRFTGMAGRSSGAGMRATCPSRRTSSGTCEAARNTGEALGSAWASSPSRCPSSNREGNLPVAVTKWRFGAPIGEWQRMVRDRSRMRRHCGAPAIPDTRLNAQASPNLQIGLPVYERDRSRWRERILAQALKAATAVAVTYTESDSLEVERCRGVGGARGTRCVQREFSEHRTPDRRRTRVAADHGQHSASAASGPQAAADTQGGERPRHGCLLESGPKWRSALRRRSPGSSSAWGWRWAPRTS